MLKQLRSIIHEVTTAKDLRTALDTLVLRVQEASHAEACSIFLLDNEKNRYLLTATAGLDKKLINKLTIKLGEGLVGLVGEREEPMNIADTYAHPKVCHYEATSKEPYRAFLGIPIIHQKELLGVLTAQKRDPDSFEETEEALLVTLTAQLAGTIAAAKASGDLERIKKTRETKIVDGISCVQGIGIGKAVVIYPIADLDAIPDKTIDDPKSELVAFRKALKDARKEIINIEKSLPENVSEAERALFDAYIQLLDSPSLKKDVAKEIRAGNWAQGALKHIINDRVAQFTAMEDEYLRERALDIKDLGQRILSALQKKPHAEIKYPKQTILVGEEIPPSVLAEVPEKQIAGIISLSGSVNSHVAILARAMNIPAVMGIKDFPITRFEDKKIILDGYYGQIYISPSKKIQQEFIDLVAQEQELDTELLAIRDLPAQTTDGYKLSLLVNTGLPIDIGHSLRVEAEGVGLYRTEVPFMTRDRFPSEDEQRIIYRQLLQIFAPRPVVMRTLDIGGDKNLPYFPISEPNPFLGWRGIRITLDHPEIFIVQVRAMIRASEGLNNLRIMLPMISSIHEVEQSKKLIKQAFNELIEEGLNVQMPLIGIMVEVPSAVYLAQDLASRVDFLSVGSNDLTQYLLAVDRNNMRVANLYDSLHPAVLKALAQVVLSAHRENKEVSICGEMAGDPVAVMLLLAMGFDALSMNANQVLKIKWLIRKFSIEDAKQLYDEVMVMDDPVEIRNHMEAALEENGAAGLIRAGR
ncbi:MAG: phosphoenolpyruvate--protein phosphotransferase [Gammaproteobacteria bacterium]|nr:phosphoenolpyruvate--protein phosphotransferase [Gammaproteobacteria bacterium]